MLLARGCASPGETIVVTMLCSLLGSVTWVSLGTLLPCGPTNQTYSTIQISNSPEHGALRDLPGMIL